MGSAGKTVEVGSFPANMFGLHDMHGNVWEWVEDSSHAGYRTHRATAARGELSCTLESYRVVRGGSWISDPNSPVRSGFPRQGYTTDHRN